MKDNMKDNMKVRELPPDTDLRTVKIRIPEAYREEAKDAGLETMEVYFHSAWLSGIWVKVDCFEDRTYPFQIPSQMVLNWDVVDDCDLEVLVCT